MVLLLVAINSTNKSNIFYITDYGDCWKISSWRGWVLSALYESFLWWAFKMYWDFVYGKLRFMYQWRI